MIKNKRLTEEELNEIVRLHFKGLSTTQIGEQLERPRHTISDALKRQGIVFSEFDRIDPLLVESLKEKNKPKMVIEIPYYFEGRLMWDITDYPQWGIDRPCICKKPDWKSEFQAKKITYYGKEYV